MKGHFKVKVEGRGHFLALFYYFDLLPFFSSLCLYLFNLIPHSLTQVAAVLVPEMITVCLLTAHAYLLWGHLVANIVTKMTMNYLTVLDSYCELTSSPLHLKWSKLVQTGMNVECILKA